MAFPLIAKNAANSFVEGGNEPLRIVTTASARFKSSKEAAFSAPVFFWPQPEARPKTTKQVKNKCRMALGITPACVGVPRALRH